MQNIMVSFLSLKKEGKLQKQLVLCFCKPLTFLYSHLFVLVFWLVLGWIIPLRHFRSFQ